MVKIATPRFSFEPSNRTRRTVSARGSSRRSSTVTAAHAPTFARIFRDWVKDARPTTVPRKGVLGTIQTTTIEGVSTDVEDGDPVIFRAVRESERLRQAFQLAQSVRAARGS